MADKWLRGDSSIVDVVFEIGSVFMDDGHYRGAPLEQDGSVKCPVCRKHHIAIHPGARCPDKKCRAAIERITRQVIEVWQRSPREAADEERQTTTL